MKHQIAVVIVVDTDKVSPEEERAQAEELKKMGEYVLNHAEQVFVDDRYDDPRKDA